MPGLAVGANPETVVGAGWLHRFSSFPCLWEISARKREAEGAGGRWGGDGETRVGDSKEPVFLPKHPQWRQAPSRWQDVAKDSRSQEGGAGDCPALQPERTSGGTL